MEWQEPICEAAQRVPPIHDIGVGLVEASDHMTNVISRRVEVELGTGLDVGSEQRVTGGGDLQHPEFVLVDCELEYAVEHDPQFGQECALGVSHEDLDGRAI